MPFTEGETVEGFKEFKNKVTVYEKDETKQPLYILFCGSEDVSSGRRSWCADCISFEELWSEFKKHNNLEHGFLLHVKVGDQEAWRKNDCPFHTDQQIKLQALPTLMRWKDKVRLDGTDIKSNENLKIFFDLK